MDYARALRDREPVTTIAWLLGHLTVAFCAQKDRTVAIWRPLT